MNLRNRMNTRHGFGMIELIVIIAIIAILLALLLPAVGSVRDAASRTQSTNNLKQIALAFHSFQDSTKRLPANGGDIPDTKYKADAQANNDFSGSWGFVILPYIEQQPMFANV